MRHARIFMAEQTRVSSLLASQGPHKAYICSTPQVFIMTDLRRTDTTEFRRRLCVPRREGASPLCRCSGCEASQESSVKMVILLLIRRLMNVNPRNCVWVGQPHPTKGGDIYSAAPTITKTPVIVTFETVTEP